MEKKTICYAYCQMNNSIIHTFQNCSWTKQFFSEVIKCFNAKNTTSLSFSQIETMFGRILNKMNAEQYPERKLKFTTLFAKYYLYSTKLTHGEISMPDSVAKVNHKCVAVICNTEYWMEIVSKCGVNWVPPLEYTYYGNNDFHAKKLHHLFSVTHCK